MNAMPDAMPEAMQQVFTDVTIRFCEHKEYGSKAAALKALKRRAPGLPSTDYAQLFDAHIDLLSATIQAFSDFRNRPEFKPKGPYSDASDIDAKAIHAILEKTFPSDGPVPILAFYSWVLYWHYLR